MKWIIYKHTLQIGPHTGWSYIGITKYAAKIRWNHGRGYSNQLFGKAIEKYGWDNFAHEILETNIETLELANEREKYWIAFFHTYINDPDCHGYNVTLGGDGTAGYTWTEASKQKLSASKLGIKHTDEYNAMLSKLIGHGEVICIETGIIYYSLGDAFRQTQIRHIHECCHHTREIAGGYHWAFLDDTDWQLKFSEFQNKEQHITKQAKRAVRCIETNKIFESITDANKWLGGVYCINRSIKTGYAAGGYHWEYVEGN